MKNKYFLMILMLFQALISCQKEEAETAKPKGSLHLDIGVLISVNERPGLFKAAPVLDEFNVHIYRADHSEVFAYENVTDMPANIELETGDYYVIAYSDNNFPADFENPYYFGQTDPFTINSNAQQDVQVNCLLANTIVSVVYSDNIINNFTGYICTVSSDAGSLVYAENESRWGYFQTLPLSIMAQLTYLKPDGSESTKTMTGSIPSPVPNRHYEIMIDASIDEGMASFQVLMDETAVAMETITLSDGPVVPPAGAVAYGEILITEIMANPTALSDTEGEWFEIYNTSDRVINLQNLILGRDDTNIHTITDPIDLAPGSYYVFSRTDLSTEVSNEYVYGSDITLANTGAVLSIYNEGSEASPGALIYALDYGETSFPSGTGASIGLNPNLLNPSDALLGNSWCISTSAYSTGDLGTPGAVNDLCQ